MIRWSWRALLGVVILFLTAPLATAPSARAGGAYRVVRSRALPARGAPLVLDRQQAQEVAVVMEFIRAYNAGHVGPALALVGPAAGWSDCDYRRGTVIVGRDTASFKRWLQQRVADHDQLEVASIAVGTEDENVLGLGWRRRRSDTLRALGHPNGIVPALGAKVLFTAGAGGASGPVIDRFANGPYAGSQAPCRVRP